MELIMQKNKYFPMALIAIAVLSGCTSTPPQNTQLTAAHSNYNDARSNPQVANLAALELKEAGDTLDKADAAMSKGQGSSTVEHLAYLANQKVGIANETARLKTAELAVTNAGAKRNEVRLEARTTEANEAKQRVAMITEVADQQSADLAAADANAQRDRATIANKSADLAAADANAQRDRATIAQQEQQLKELNAKKTDRGMVITLGDVLFRTGRAQLEAGGMHNVQKLADFLKQSPKTKVMIEGHTDSVGSTSSNLVLSDRRASAVKMALADKGISSDRISTRGYGEAYPVAGNHSAAERQLNRRVEVILSDANGNIAPR
jgi:outer membrane protein OmpA-like peptidoglycan-associated protein